MSPFRNELPHALTDGGRDDAVHYLRTYFGTDSVPSRYTGSRFERLGGGGDRAAVANTLTAEDIVAVSLLSVDVPGSAAITILEDRHEFFGELLREIPVDLKLVDVSPEQIVRGWAPWRLETALRSIHGLGPTTASKLMARKRPHLVPVFDTLVDGLLRPADGFWSSLNAHLRKDGHALDHHLLSLREEAGIGDDISTLRIFDVVAWRSAKDKVLSSGAAKPFA